MGVKMGVKWGTKKSGGVEEAKRNIESPLQCEFRLVHGQQVTP